MLVLSVIEVRVIELRGKINQGLIVKGVLGDEEWVEHALSNEVRVANAEAAISLQAPIFNFPAERLTR